MNEFLNKIQKFRFNLNLQVVLRCLIVATVFFMLGIHIYYLVWLNVSAQSVVLIYLNYILRLGIIFLIIWIFYRGIKHFYRIGQTARWLDKQTEHQDDLYQNLYELYQQKEDESILKVLALQATERLKSVSYRLPKLFPADLWFLILFLLIGIGSVWSFSADTFRYAMKQFAAITPETVAYKSTIDVIPGNITLGRGQQLVIQVVEPDTRLHHRLFYRWDENWRELGLNNYSYTFPSLEYTLEYYVQNEVAKSPVYRVECLDEPFVKSWVIDYHYPAYTGLGNVRDTLSYGNIEAFKHTEVILSISTNIPINKAIMHFSDGTTQTMQQVDANDFTTRLKVLSPKTWYLELNDILGRSSEPEEKTISIIPDNPPEIRILYPAQDVMLDQSLQLPLIISASDDFGLKNLSLHYQVNERPAQSIILQSVINTKLFTTDYHFDMNNLNLLPGDNVTYWAEVYDNSPDHQSAQTPKYKARFPSMEEIYKEIERLQNKQTQDLQSTLKEAHNLEKDFEKKRLELMKQDKISWEDAKQLEKMLNTQEKLTEQVENIAQDYQQLIDKLKANEALSAETLQKMQRIQELMQEINTDELREAMSKVNEALRNLKPEDLRKAMENLKFSMEDFNKKIDQTLQLLESIKKEQALDKALQISKEMEKMQSALMDKTQDPTQSNEQLAREQKNIADKLENLKEAMEQANQLLDPSKDKQIKQDLNDLLQEMNNGQLSQNLQQSQQQLQQNQRSAASQSQSQALEKMRQFTKRLSDMKNAMSGSSQQEVVNAMQKAIRELLIFSKQHESLKARYSQDPYLIIPDLIAEYEGMQMSLNKLFSIPQVTMFIPPKFYMDLSDTDRSFKEIFNSVNQMQYYQIPQQLENIQKGLNLMVYDLMQTLNNPSAGMGGGSGMQSLLQMLEQMGQEQMAMNMLAEQLMMQLQQQGGRMGAAMQQQIQKLAAEEERLAENLKRALQNNPEAQKQGNAIQQIIDEVEAVSRQLKNNQLTPEVLQSQERILSRLLDAQRSINKREFSEKRKGETANPEIKQQAVETDYETLRRKAMLDDTYRLFPPAYQQVILKYLKLLNE
ncbi:MAG TPA: hypothetical protein PK707_02215 [Candidatus Syntrophosphaera thermopropionivorans]|jgi:hypothetical protein|nr:hypothetical protein [Candidatus Syntrophosphaera thermopropionivorans]HOZ91942.1 hypothetical protein [Candidatus Syntrophosphaera thermopropionivorans]HPW24784.1 hypothetical protein [Candidatus Syntrophosphaera thermopropionivorans]HQF81658.1 hypothetical protein [Candidatus Syntrophosphaera thermopropionivorans]HRD00731.1 hypothetical protein [Candidatus Syntrophosphaera thermopropionivorans]